MKKKIWLASSIIIGLLILSLAALSFYLNKDEIHERTGMHFDSSGKQLGACKVVTFYKKLATVPYRSTSYFYSADNKELGQCDNEVLGCDIKSAITGLEERYTCTF